MFFILIFKIFSTEYFAKWGGDNKSICHPMWPCDWKIAVSLFSKDDVIQLTDSIINTSEQLEVFYNMSSYIFKIGGGLASNNAIIDGQEYNHKDRDFYLEISPFNESVLFGFHFLNFNNPILSVRGMDLFLIINCSFKNNFVSFDFPLLTFSNVTTIMANCTIFNNLVEGTSLIGLNTAILGVFNSSIESNIQISRGSIPLIEFTNAASEITNSTIKNNIIPNSPLLGSWFFIIVIVQNSIIENNNCGNSALIVGDSLANITMDNATISNNIGAILHSMTMSSINLSRSIINNNKAYDQALIFAPRSTLKFLNDTIVSENIADSIISSELSNETSLHLISTIFFNNTCTSTAFALFNSESKIQNATLISNTIINNPLLSLKISNFTINNSSFFNNWIIDKGSILFIEGSSLEVNLSNFNNNFALKSSVFEVSLNNILNHSFIFSYNNFSNNKGNNFDSIFYSKIIP